ncbi:MAG: type II toxin-antitoxin system Phd/YefM family antitoxin [Caldilineaceae bacterium]
MSTYTITLNEAETQLRKLVEQAQATHRPVILTAEGTHKPVAVLLESNAFEETQRDRQQLFQLQRAILFHWLERVEEKWNDPAIRQRFVAVWQDNIKTLWDKSPIGARRFCTSLALSVQQLSAERLSIEQVTALRYALDVLRVADPDDNMVRVAYQKLRDNHLSPRLTFDRELAQSYIDEL